MPTPKQERGTVTRIKVLDAAVDCLVDLGYTKTTAGIVADRAGVSRGAMQYHFRTKSELLAAAVEHLVARLSEQTHQTAGRLPPIRTSQRYSAAIEALWTSSSAPLFVAWLELSVAARADSELNELLSSVRGKLAKAVRDQGLELFGFDGPDGQVETFIEMTLAMFTGMSVVRFTGVDGGSRRTSEERQILTAWKSVATFMLLGVDQ